MVQTVRFHRQVLLELTRGPWTEAWFAAARISADAVSLLLPSLRRSGARIRVITCLDPARLAEGKLDMAALQMLRTLPGSEIRHLPELAACVYAFGPEGGALVTGTQLTLEGLDSLHSYGALLADPAPVVADLEQWWAQAHPFDDEAWALLAMETSQRLEARALGDEVARVGGFVRVAMRGTRRTRRLDPREFGVPEGDWGRAVRPVEVALFKLDEVIRAKDDLEAVLAEHGLEWNGHYLVPRHFLERDWPRLFAARERQLRERLQSPDGRAALKSQLSQARRELEAFFGEIYPRAESQGMAADVWVDTQATKVLADTVSETILEDSGLEYRVLTILPQDPRSVEEVQRLLQDPKLRSVQLTFQI
ncbi:MAG TPA: hypothetical protein VD969_05830 [Symbiobacteriaceae bacterium]|nr:hypothetical protein [Symbiobacteriaceae bacterium]